MTYGKTKGQRVYSPEFNMLVISSSMQFRIIGDDSKDINELCSFFLRTRWYLDIAILSRILPTGPEHMLSSVSIYFWTNHPNISLDRSAFTPGPTT